MGKLSFPKTYLMIIFITNKILRRIDWFWNCSKYLFPDFNTQIINRIIFQHTSGQRFIERKYGHRSDSDGSEKQFPEKVFRSRQIARSESQLQQKGMLHQFVKLANANRFLLLINLRQNGNVLLDLKL